MQAGFIVIKSGKDVEFRVFGPSLGERRCLVRFYQDGDQAVVLMGRLYYRDDLLGQLSADLTEELAREARCNDAALALAAYRCLGRECFARLEGDFSVVVWDRSANRLVGARDSLGGYPLFWARSGDSLALSTSIRPLLDLLPRHDLNEDYLAEFLTLPGCGMQDLRGGCPYKGVSRVGAGAVVEVDLLTDRAAATSYWDWLAHVCDPGAVHLDALGDRFAALFRRAVSERLHGQTAAHLSGGMDSTAVSLVARDCLKASGGPLLHTLSLVYDRLAGLALETPYLEAVLRQAEGIVPHRISGDVVLDFDSFARAPALEEPCPWLARMGMDQVLVEEAARNGADTLLTGLGADELLDAPPLYLTELLRRGRLWSAWQQAGRWARAQNCSHWKLLYPYGLANLLPFWARPELGSPFQGGYAPWHKQGDYTIAPWIRPAFARRQGLRARALAHCRRTYHSCRPAALSYGLAAIDTHRGDMSRWYLAAPHGMVISHPFLDRRLVCWGLGGLQHCRPEPGAQKPILARAMRDVLPEEILQRRRKGNFNEVYFLGLVRNLPILEALIHRAPSDQLEWLNKEVLLECLHRAALGGATGASALDRLNLTLALLHWLTSERDRPQGRLTAEVIFHSRSCPLAAAVC